jgi:hypothetical protein
MDVDDELKKPVAERDVLAALAGVEISHRRMAHPPSRPCRLDR